MSLADFEIDQLEKEIRIIIDEETDTAIDNIRDAVEDEMGEVYTRIMDRIPDLLSEFEEDSSDLNDAVRRMANRQAAPVQNNQSITQNGVTYATTINARIDALRTYLHNQQINGASQQELNITKAKINELENLVGQIGR